MKRRQAVLSAIRSKRSSYIKARLGYGGFISTKHRYFYLETPKAGSTKTKELLWAIEGFPPRTENIHHRGPNDPRLSPVNVPSKIARDALFSGDYVRFITWRDPVKRLASAYKNKLVDRYDTSPVWPRLADQIAQRFCLADPAAVSFEHFARFACSQKDEDRDPHYRSQCSILLTDYLDYDFVVDLDRYVAQMGQVLRRLGINEYPDLGAKTKVSGSENVEIAHEVAALIRDSYASDYLIKPRPA